MLLRTEDREIPNRKQTLTSLRAASQCWLHPNRQEGLSQPWASAGCKLWWGPRSCLFGGQGRWVPSSALAYLAFVKGDGVFSLLPVSNQAAWPLLCVSGHIPRSAEFRTSRHINPTPQNSRGHGKGTQTLKLETKTNEFQICQQAWGP